MKQRSGLRLHALNFDFLRGQVYCAFDTPRRRKRRNQWNLTVRNPSTPAPDALVAATTAAVVMHAGHMIRSG